MFFWRYFHVSDKRAARGVDYVRVARHSSAMELILLRGARKAREHKTTPTGEQRECSCETPPQNVAEAGPSESQAGI